jgi:drug/metabolite transporter (DMT)-like permease
VRPFIVDGDEMSRLAANCLLCCAALVWGMAFIAQKTGMETIGPMGFTFSRYLMGALFILPLALFESRRTSFRRHVADRPRLGVGAVALGGLMFCGMALQQTALLYTSVANAAFLTALYVPLVPLIAALFLRRKVALNVWPAVALSLLGSFLLSGTSGLAAQLGDWLTAFGALFWACHILLAQWMMVRVNAPFQMSFVQSLVTAVLAGAATLVFEAPEFADFLPVWPQILFAGVVSVGIGFTIQLVAQRHTTAAAAALILSLESVFAALFGWWLLEEGVIFIGAVGCCLIFAAIIIAEALPEERFKQFLGLSRKS